MFYSTTFYQRVFLFVYSIPKLFYTINQKINYDKHKNINIIYITILNDVLLRSLPLLEKYAIEDGNYAEQIEIWSDYLLNLNKKILLMNEEK